MKGPSAVRPCQHILHRQSVIRGVHIYIGARRGVRFNLLWRRMKPLGATAKTRRKLCGELCEISVDTERPGLGTAEKSSSGVNPPDLKSCPPLRLSYKFSLVDSPFSLDFWTWRVLLCAKSHPLWSSEDSLDSRRCSPRCSSALNIFHPSGLRRMDRRPRTRQNPKTSPVRQQWSKTDQVTCRLDLIRSSCPGQDLIYPACIDRWSPPCLLLFCSSPDLCFLPPRLIAWLNSVSQFPRVGSSSRSALGTRDGGGARFTVAAKPLDPWIFRGLKWWYINIKA